MATLAGNKFVHRPQGRPGSLLSAALRDEAGGWVWLVGPQPTRGFGALAKGRSARGPQKGMSRRVLGELAPNEAAAEERRPAQRQGPRHYWMAVLGAPIWQGGPLGSGELML
jgi:hypothetical protein